MTDHELDKLVADIAGVEVEEGGGAWWIRGSRTCRDKYSVRWYPTGKHGMTQAMQVAEAMWDDGFYYFIRPDRVTFHQTDAANMRSSKVAYSGVANLPRAICEAAVKVTENENVGSS